MITKLKRERERERERGQGPTTGCRAIDDYLKIMEGTNFESSPDV
jgi:hypothetical protein